MQCELSLSYSLTLSLNFTLKHSLSHSETGLAAHLRALHEARENFPARFDGEHRQIQAAFAFELCMAKGHIRAVLPSKDIG